MVDIVIVNWNSGPLLKKCIDSILPVHEAFVHKVFVIDNRSSDDSLAGIEGHSQVTVERNNTNLGFSKACNQGFRLCTAEYVLLLNPDTRLFADTLDKCMRFMASKQDVDILGCQLLNESGEVTRSCARFPTPSRLLLDATGLPRLAPRLFRPAILMNDWDHGTDRIVDEVMGAFMFMRRTIFDKNGFFDEQFFVYYEELDFCKRVAENGGRVFYKAGIRAIHTGMGTTDAIKAMRLFLNLRSRLQYCKKTFLPRGLPARVPEHLQP